MTQYDLIMFLKHYIGDTSFAVIFFKIHLPIPICLPHASWSSFNKLSSNTKKNCLRTPRGRLLVHFPLPFVAACEVLHAQSVVSAICDPIDCGPPSSSVHGIFQARILEWVAISLSRESSWPRDWTHNSCISSTGRWVPHHCTTREVPQCVKASLRMCVSPAIFQGKHCVWAHFIYRILCTWCCQIPANSN